MAQLLRIGQVASRSGLSPDAIRYYERLGLLTKPLRSAGGYRQYPESVLNRIGLVRSAQRFGFSLREIAAFLRVREAGGHPCRDVRSAAARLLDAVDAQIAELMATRTHMADTLRTWDQALAHTPSDRPARLLETLAATTGRQVPARRRI
jgi:DNA-binding transcriptional MerR regulator